MHRDYDVIGSEVHVDMYDDRLEIYSPGGMPDGTLIQEQQTKEIHSTRRNLIIADIFHHLGYIERRGSGIEKILNTTSVLYGYTEEHKPVFRSTPTSFHVILRNMNYNLDSASEPVNDQDKIKEILLFCKNPRTRKNIKHMHFMMSKSDSFDIIQKQPHIPATNIGKGL